MMRFKYPNWLVLTVITTGLLLAFSSQSFATAEKMPQNVACDGKIDWQIAPDAEITSFECALGTHGIDAALIFKATLKNVSQTPLRFRINIFLLDMDKAAGHLVPRKGKPPVVAPGEEAKVKIPFIKTEAMSNDMMVIVKPLATD